MTKKASLQGLYGITDSSLLPDDESLLGAVEAALEGGMRILQYRDKSVDDAGRLRQARALQRLCSDYGASLIINDDVDLALAVNAAGVHLGREDGAIAGARARLADDFIIGASCYNDLELARLAQDQGADYVAFGRFFPSKTKPDAASAEPGLINQAKAEISVPICAIGGITVDNAASLIERGINMVAVVHDLFAASDIRSRATVFSELFARF